MRIINYLFAVLMFLTSCSNADRIVDKSKLRPGDYRLFQGTPVWMLAKSAYNDDMAAVKKILAEKPDLANVQDSVYGNTLLMLAIINQDYDLFKLLIDNGAEINYHNKFGGVSPLIEACSYRENNPIFVKDLVENGACVNDTTHSLPMAQASPLMVAAGCGNISIARYLLELGADINYKNNIGTTVLGESILTKKYDVALVLLNNGADFSSPIYNTLDEYGKLTVPTNLQTALRDGMIDIGTSEYFQKRKIIKFLKTRGIDYDTVPIPDYVVERAKENYPLFWKAYLQLY